MRLRNSYRDFSLIVSKTAIFDIVLYIVSGRILKDLEGKNNAFLLKEYSKKHLEKNLEKTEKMSLWVINLQ